VERRTQWLWILRQNLILVATLPCVMALVEWFWWATNPKTGYWDTPTIRGILNDCWPIGVGLILGMNIKSWPNETGKYPFYFLFPKSRERVARRKDEIETKNE